MMFSGSIPSSAPRVFSSDGFTEKPNTATTDTPSTQKPHCGIPGNMPTIEFVTRYMKRSMPAQPNSAMHVESGARQMPFQTRASIRCDTPIVKQRSIMLW